MALIKTCIIDISSQKGNETFLIIHIFVSYNLEDQEYVVEYDY